MNKNLDMKNLRILKELDENPDITLRQLAKNVRLSHQVVEYRLRNLVQNNVISSISPWINFGKLGYMMFRVHARFRNVTKERKKEFEKWIYDNHSCFCLGAWIGTWDIYIDILAETPSDFEKEFDNITKKFADEIQEYDILIVNKIHVYNYKYIMEDIQPREFLFQDTYTKEKLDDIDIKILKILSKNSRIPLLQIASEINLSRSSVKERIKKLYEKGIISSNRMTLNFKPFGRESYKIFLKIRNNEDQKRMLLQFAKTNKDIIYVVELIGTYQLDLEIQIKDREKLQNLLITLRNKFPIIHHYEIMSHLYDEGINFFPLYKEKK